MKMIEDNENRIEELKNKEKNKINEIAENKKIIADIDADLHILKIIAEEIKKIKKRNKEL
jgi:hypothetical protein